MTSFQDRVHGCLLGGALGDALGFPVEGATWWTIQDRHGPSGVTGPVPDREGVVGRISDDTQLTLFTAEALLRDPSVPGVHQAYLRWLDTQEHPEPPPAGSAAHRTGRLREERWLYARRGPGRACLHGLAQGYAPDPQRPWDGTPGPVNPDSKGCGTVMRSAPFGFTGGSFELAARCSLITHGHPTAAYAAGAYAFLVGELTAGQPLEPSVRRALALLARYPGHRETSTALERALALAATGPATVDRLEDLGAGWVAEEALAVGVYAALAAPGPAAVGPALLLAVNHSGDSDSTGAICGALLGARYGAGALPPAWVAQLEGRAVIAALADGFGFGG
ncbi:ADP-ribosylglycohydrolase family protein [Kitasatospora sp. NPDC096147]|uniref:ADP-ribosylglycohydrolase family protein n=1 Tax=Kitasatospora sp. NPDC096147 TaxID=3364093 RepID=UPI003823A76F